MTLMAVGPVGHVGNDRPHVRRNKPLLQSYLRRLVSKIYFKVGTHGIKDAGLNVSNDMMYTILHVIDNVVIP